jgi:hypothetical protein
MIDRCPDVIHLLRIQHAGPWWHLILAVEHGMSKALVLVGL